MVEKLTWEEAKRRIEDLKEELKTIEEKLALKDARLKTLPEKHSEQSRKALEADIEKEMADLKIDRDKATMKLGQLRLAVVINGMKTIANPKSRHVNEPLEEEIKSRKRRNIKGL